MVRFLLGLGVLGCCFGFLGLALAQDSDPQRRARHLSEWRQRLRLSRLRSREGALLEEVERLDLRKQDLEQQRFLWLKRVRAVEQKVKERRQEVVLQKEICRAMIQTMRPRVRLFYRVSRLGRGRILLGSRTLRAMALRWRLLRYLTARDLKLLQDYQAMRLRVEDTITKLKKDQAHLVGVVNKLKKQQAQIQAYREEKQTALQLIYQEAELYKRAVSELKHSDQGLTRLLRGKAGAQAAQGILALKGKLPWPIQTFTPYCERYKLHLEGSFRALQCEKMAKTPKPLRTPLGRAGITLVVPSGSPVQAVATGRVVYHGWRRGYGMVLILDHGQRFYTVYAHLSSLMAQVNQVVSMGEVIALSGATGAMGGPSLYFEIRYPVRPLPPEDWLRTVTPPL
ncbi:MAG: M23 family metallopeptidase [Myxococcales bacterium]|nr:M23 family metallopeptidase [Myxococcales bacterium]